MDGVKGSKHEVWRDAWMWWGEENVCGVKNEEVLQRRGIATKRYCNEEAWMWWREENVCGVKRSVLLFTLAILRHMLASASDAFANRG
jgi:hypothetical protein